MQGICPHPINADSQVGEKLIEMGWTGQVLGLVMALLER
jgi:hypothetical protein